VTHEDVSHSKLDNPEAFPNSTGVRCWSTGMTLRDYFAAAALTGFLSSGVEQEGTPEELIATVGPACYGMADQLLAQRAKEVSDG